MSVKLGMSKAFDRIEWKFLEAVLHAMRFPNRLVSLIMKCISTVQFSFMLNGPAFGSLEPQRGIRQSDLLYMYLFIMCSEVFSSILQDLQSCGRIRGVKVAGTAPTISHPLFADDTLLLGNAMVEEATNLKFAISLYERVTVTGQLVNYDKSGVV